MVNVLSCGLAVAGAVFVRSHRVGSATDTELGLSGSCACGISVLLAVSPGTYCSMRDGAESSCSSLQVDEPTGHRRDLIGYRLYYKYSLV